jgi:hypothetical protein
MTAKLDPRKAAEFMISAGYQPLEPYKTAIAKWRCVHIACGRTVQIKYNAIQQGKGGCMDCSLKKSAISRTFTESHAIQIMLDKHLKPLESYAGSMRSWKCECLKCGKIVYPALASIQRTKKGCAYCSGRRVDATDAEELMKRNNFLPLEKYKNALEPWKCRCTLCGKISSPQYSNVKKGASCIYCAKRKVDIEYVESLMLKADLEPLEPYAGNKTPWKSKCLKCHRIVYPRWNDLQKGHSGCIYCAPKGINLLKPSYVYLITNTELSAHKVGIGNKKKTHDRLSKFIATGWLAHKTWPTETGKIALEIEDAVFKILRIEMKLPIYLSYEDMPKTQGHSETVDADSITLLELEKIIEKVIKGHRKNPQP